VREQVIPGGAAADAGRPETYIVRTFRAAVFDEQHVFPVRVENPAADCSIVVYAGKAEGTAAALIADLGRKGKTHSQIPRIIHE
jgi:hypothetical protein